MGQKSTKTNPPKKRGPGQPSKYDPARTEAVCKAIASGMPEKLASEYAGYSVASHCAYKKQYPEYLEAIRVARMTALKGYLDVIERAAKGGAEYETQEIVKKNKDGSIEKKTIVKKQPPNWNAAAWWAARQFVEEFGENRVEVSKLLKLIEKLLMERDGNDGDRSTVRKKNRT